jgi:hypothetical protein
VGDGFSLDLADLLAAPAFPGDPADDVNNIRIVFSADRSVIDDLIDITSGTNITFVDTGGRVDFLEETGGNPYFIQLIQDQSPSSTLSNVQGQFVQRVPVPWHGTLALVALGWGTRVRGSSPFHGGFITEPPPRF